MEYIICFLGIILYSWDNSNAQYRINKKFRKEIEKERREHHIELARKHHPH